MLFSSSKLVFILILLFLPTLILADSVHFKNGRVLLGKITSQDRNILVIQTESGIRRIPKSSIRIARYGARVKPSVKRARKVKKKQVKRPGPSPVLVKPSPTRVAEKKVVKPSASFRRPGFLHSGPHWSALWRSLLLPGWGQYYLGKSPHAATALGGVAVSLGLLAFAADESVSRGQQVSSGETRNLLVSGAAFTHLLLLTPAVNRTLGVYYYSQLLDARSRADLASLRERQSLSLLGLVYLAQAAHAYFSGYKSFKKSTLASGKQAKGILRLESDGRYQLGIQFRF